MAAAAAGSGLCVVCVGGQFVWAAGRGVQCRIRPLICPCLSLPPPWLSSPLPPPQYSDWVAEVMAHKAEHPLGYPDRDDVIMPQHAIEVGGALGWPRLWGGRVGGRQGAGQAAGAVGGWQMCQLLRSANF